MTGLRLGVTAFLVLAVVFQNLRDQMHFAAFILVAGLIGVVIYTNEDRLRGVRNLAIIDLYLFLAVIPVLVFSQFVAAQTGDLLPAERSTFAETSLIAFFAIVGLVSIAGWFYRHDHVLLAAVILPGLLCAVTLTYVLHDYRNQTALAMITVSYFIGAVAIALAVLVDGMIRRYVPVSLYLLTLFAGVVLIQPGLGNLGERAGLVQTVSVLFILLSLGVLFALAIPGAIAQISAIMLKPAPDRNHDGRRVDHEPGRPASSRG